jgi:hypothetical protein
MKKFFMIFAIAGTLVACNNDAETTTTEDTTVVAPAEPVMETAPMDTTAVVVDTTATN